MNYYDPPPITIGIFLCFGDDFCQLFHFIINGIYSMTISFDFFILASCRCIDEVLHITKIKMAEQQYFSAIKKIIALDI